LPRGFFLWLFILLCRRAQKYHAFCLCFSQIAEPIYWLYNKIKMNKASSNILLTAVIAIVLILGALAWIWNSEFSRPVILDNAPVPQLDQ